MHRCEGRGRCEQRGTNAAGSRDRSVARALRDWRIRAAASAAAAALDLTGDRGNIEGRLLAFAGNFAVLYLVVFPLMGCAAKHWGKRFAWLYMAAGIAAVFLGNSMVHKVVEALLR